MTPREGHGSPKKALVTPTSPKKAPVSPKIVRKSKSVVAMSDGTRWAKRRSSKRANDFSLQARGEKTQDEPADHTEGDEHNKECFNKVWQVCFHQAQFVI